MRGSAVPTMVWSSAASSSASITPAVARTLMRVVSSPCGMGFSLLNAQRLDETQTQMTKLNQLGVLEPVGQGRLDPCGLTPERIHAVTALVRDLRVDGAPVRGIGDAPDQAVALQDLADPRIEEEALRVGLERWDVEFWMGSEVTHIYVTHYYIAQETGA